MEGFTIVDGVVALIIVVSAVLAYSRGFVRETLAILGWIVAAVLAYIFAPKAEPLVREIPFVGDFLDSCELSLIAAFAGVFAIALVLVSIFTPLFSSAVQRSAVGGVDQGLGFLFGVLRGMFLVAIAIVVYKRVNYGEGIEMVDKSRTAQVFANAEATLEETIPEDIPGWFLERYEELVGVCYPDGRPVSIQEAPPAETDAADSEATTAQ